MATKYNPNKGTPDPTASTDRQLEQANLIDVSPDNPPPPPENTGPAFRSKKERGVYP